MKLEVVILAAGQGTRMKSDLPKVLHPVGGRPMLARVLDTALRLQPAAIHVVIGHGAERVRETLGDYDVTWVEQRERLGTGHAVAQALPAVGEDATVLVLYGDTPLVGADTLSALVRQAERAPALLTARLPDPAGYGRILRDEAGSLAGVVEEKDADAQQRAITEVNTGVMAAPSALLRDYLPRVGNNNRQGEYYLPDVLSLAVADGLVVATAGADSEMDILGVNDREQLNRVEREFQRRLACALMREGVSIADAGRMDVRGELRCGRDVSIDVNAVFEGAVELGDGVVIGPNCCLADVSVGAGTVVHAFSHLQDARVGAGCAIGPYARLRPGTELADTAKIGNFVETKNARIGAGSKVNHLAYIGDTSIGGGANIGAGTITCNYDGAHKHRTEIGDGVFVGSNATLVAPLSLAEGSFVAAGSTVTKDVPAADLAVGRGRQRNISGWQRPVKNNGES